MLIKSKLYIIIACFIAVLVSFSVISYFNLLVLDEYEKNKSIIHDITKSSFNLNLIANDYASFPSQRAAQQWDNEFQRINSLIEQLGILENNKHIQIIKDDLSTVDSKFNEIVSAPSSEYGTLLSNEISIDLLHLQSTVTQIERDFDIQSEFQINSSVYVIAVIIALAGIISIAGIGITKKQIVKPLYILRSKATDFSITNPESSTKIQNSNDEIGDLGKVFEKMTKKMRLDYEQLELLNKQKDLFSSMISHELKTPLTPIIGWCDALTDPDIFGHIPENQLKAIKTIKINARKLEKIIGDLLNSSKLEMGQFRVQKNKFKVNDMIQDLINDFSLEFDKQNIEVENRSQKEIILNSDQQRLEEVLINLLSNAMDFCSKDNGKIVITTEDFSDKVLFGISDNGKGIPKDKHDDIFKKFYQVDTSATRKHGGTGLGLSICKGIVEILGGEIWVESDVGKGTTFYFSIPKGDNI